MTILKRDELKNLKVQTRRKEKQKKETIDKSWLLKVMLTGFIISLILSLISEKTLTNVPLLIAILITLLFIFIGVLFDVIVMAVTICDEKVFHSMNSKRLKAANV